MREIKFRAWDKEDELMLSDVSLHDDTWDMMNEFFRNKEELVFMQSTEYADIHDKIIYMGDIVILSGEEPYISEQISTDYNFKLKGILQFKDARFEVAIGGSVTIPLSEWIYDFIENVEVIGNIYENPELIEDD